jgi:hypothetical protein
MTPSGGRKYSILRVRPLAVIADGLPEDRLREIGESLLDEGSGESSRPLVKTFGIPPNWSPFDESLVGRLALMLKEALEDSKLVVIDMNFDRTIPRYAMLAVLLFQAMTRLTDDEVAEKRITILVEKLPAPTDDLSLLAQDVRFMDSVIVADAAGKFYSPTTDDWLGTTNVPKMIGPTTRESHLGYSGGEVYSSPTLASRPNIRHTDIQHLPASQNWLGFLFSTSMTSFPSSYMTVRVTIGSSKPLRRPAPT